MTESFAHGVVIVGASMAGGRAAEALRGAGYDGRLVLIGDEPVRPYERPPLSKEFLRGETPIDKAFLRAQEWYTDNAVELMLDARAESLDVEARTVTLTNTEMLRWDRLLLATGARPRTLDVPGGMTPGVFTLRTAHDAITIGEHLKPGARVVVVGAGFIGAEVAASARMLGCDVHVVETLDVPLKRALGEEVGRVYAQIHRDNGVILHLGVNVESIVGETWVNAVVLSDGTRLDADVVIVGVGVEPNVELAETAGRISCSNGILVNERCETSAPGVYAAGDVANHPNPILGEHIRIEHWQNAQNQGAHAGKAMLGAQEPFSEVPWFWSDQYDVNLQMAGHPTTWDRTVTRGSLEERDGVVFYLNKTRMVAAVGLNRGKDVRASRALIAAAVAPDDAVLADPSTDLRALAKK